MPNTKTLVLNHLKIQQKIDRIAYQIYEGNADESEIIIAGVDGNGFLFAKRLVKALEEISSIKIKLIKLSINKEQPYKQDLEESVSSVDFKNKVVVVVDDVLNSGKTLIYAVKVFLNVPLKRIRTAVLVDRNHSRFPIKADFVGLSLSTTLKEHISVELDKRGEEAVYLT